MTGLTIGQLAARSGVSADTLRYYEKLGLLGPGERTAAGYRLYDRKAERVLRFIRGAKDLGFTLEEIRRLLTLKASDTATCADVLATAERKIAEAEARIRELQAVKRVLEDLARHCPGDGSATDDCPILEHLLHPADSHEENHHAR